LAGGGVERPDRVVVRRHVEDAVLLHRVRLLAAPRVRVQRVEVDGEDPAELRDVTRIYLRQRRVAVLVRRVAEAAPAGVAVGALPTAERRAAAAPPASASSNARPWVAAASETSSARPVGSGR